ncbi:hypothetical protein BKA70DRAFT_1428787 [Coprinopsis sp. MPI-PUGE-AT-0042]|nr:hypothetical protein BKA70DRAFT_1428787 [Coprinopsis sp. MPI-PUGE-AT-0042]
MARPASSFQQRHAFMASTYRQTRSMKTRIQPILETPGSGAEPEGLLVLPPEILASVMEFAEWNDVLKLRQCCRALRDVSRMRSVWLELLKGYCDTLFYRPFFLKKPLEFCSAADLEEAVTRSWRPISPTVDETPMSEIKAPEGERWASLAGPTPDGSCLLYFGHHGELSYYFISNPAEPHLLIPSPFACSCTAMTMRFTIDRLAYQGIDPGSPSLFEERLFPSRFNLAVLHSITHRGGRHEVLAEVWQIIATLRQGHVEGYTSKRLASFCEDPTFYILGCSLRGNHLAYQPAGSRTIVVVDWTALPETSTEYPRVYVEARDPVKSFALIPGKRLLTRASSLKIWEWGQDCLVSRLPPSEVRKGLDLQQIILSGPSWERKFDRNVVVRHLTLNPFFAHGSTRFVLPSATQTYGLDISSTSIDEGSNPRVFTLTKDYVETSAFQQYHSYRRGVRVLNDRTSLVVQYPWPDDIVQWSSRVDSFKLSRDGDHILYNDAYSRIDLFAPKDLKYHSTYI